MAVDNLWVLAHIKTTNHTLSQITDYSLDPGVAEIIAGFDGEPDNSFIAPGLVAPAVTFSSANIKACLDATGVSSLALAAAETFTGHFQKVVQGGTRAAASSNHLAMLIGEGILVPRTITVENNGLASISMAAIATQAGTALPVIITDDQTYTASASGLIGWTLGPVKANGTAIPGVQRMTFDFGVEVETASGDGEGFPTFVFVQRRQPRITFTTKNANSIDTLSETGKTGSNTVIYLRNISTVGNGVVRIADATQTHIEFTVVADYESPRTIGGTHGSSVDFEIDLIPKWDGSTAQIQLDTTAAIT